MAAKLGSTGSDDDLAETHEINVTPFIDVILVLLIIFMVAAPLATVDVPVDLPSSTATPQPKPDKPLYLTVKSDLSLVIGDNPLGEAELGATLDQATAQRPRPAHLPARRQDRRLRRPDEGDERPAGVRISQDRAGRP